MVGAMALVSAVLIVTWSARVRVGHGSVRPATFALLVLALVPFVFLYAASIASDAWLTEHVSVPNLGPFDDFLVAGLVSIAVIVGVTFVGWEAWRQRSWAMAITCCCAGALALASLALMIAIIVFFGLLSQLGSVAGGGWT